MSRHAMKSYLIEPLAPLVVRSGRPFDDQAGADGARFPPPSTLAGALRTAVAEGRGEAFSTGLADIPVTGPLPVSLDASGRPCALLVPKPADALCFWTPDKQQRRLVRAQPGAFAGGEGADLDEGLMPVCLTESVRGKPAPAPQWWAMDDFLRFRCGETPDVDAVACNGWSPAHSDVRTHVAIDPQRLSAEDGKLFQTAGLEFARTGLGSLSHAIQPVGLLGRIAGDIPGGVITLGGERRLSAVSVADDSLWPVAGNDLLHKVEQAGGLLVSLLTPALFSEGWRPGWLDESLQGTPPDCEGVQLRLRAAALDRWQPHSGWDLAAKAARAGRKLVPAGAVFWFEIVGGKTEALRPLWLGSVCDHEQDRRDGFGLSIFHPWRVPRGQ